MPLLHFTVHRHRQAKGQERQAWQLLLEFTVHRHRQAKGARMLSGRQARGRRGAAWAFASGPPTR